MTIPRISDTEWVVMKVLWEKSPLTSGQVVNALGNEKWKPRTIKTLLSRLVEKKAVKIIKDEKHYLYYPLAAKDECIVEESRSFINRVFNGAFSPMINRLITDKQLSEQEMQELKDLLEKTLNDTNKEK